jgi:hypothetical protein
MRKNKNRIFGPMVFKNKTGSESVKNLKRRAQSQQTLNLNLPSYGTRKDFDYWINVIMQK